MTQIWKYRFESGNIMMPKGAKILTVQMQNDTPYMWAIVDVDAELEERVFEIHGTGHNIRNIDEHEYIGTYIDNPFVWHLFELIKNK
jgi:hypothetical protein